MVKCQWLTVNLGQVCFSSSILLNSKINLPPRPLKNTEVKNKQKNSQKKQTKKGL